MFQISQFVLSANISFSLAKTTGENAMKNPNEIQKENTRKRWAKNIRHARQNKCAAETPFEKLSAAGQLFVAFVPHSCHVMATIQCGSFLRPRGFLDLS